MKRLIILLLALGLIFIFAGCGGTPEVPTEPDENGEISEPEENGEGVVEGVPFEGGTLTKMVGSTTLTAEWLPIEGSLVVDSIFDSHVALSGDSCYILTDGGVKRYAFDGSSLEYKEELALDAEYDYLCTDDSGVVYLSAFMKDFVAFQDGSQLFAHDGPSKVAMHPSGEWGISWFHGPDVERVVLGDGTMETEPWQLKEVSSIRHMNIGQDHIFISGEAVSNEEQTVFVYDLQGNHKVTLGGTEFGEPDSLGSMTVVVETANGFLGLDGNMRNVLFWKADGTFIGAVDDGDLFGTRYPWLSTAVLMPDGTILVGMTEERPDKSADEFLLFKLSGF